MDVVVGGENYQKIWPQGNRRNVSPKNLCRIFVLISARTQTLVTILLLGTLSLIQDF